MLTFVSTEPFAELLTHEEVMSNVMRGYQLHKPPNCNDALYELIRECIRAHLEPSQRPSFRDIAKKNSQIEMNKHK